MTVLALAVARRGHRDTMRDTWVRASVDGKLRLGLSCAEQCSAVRVAHRRRRSGEEDTARPTAQIVLGREALCAAFDERQGAMPAMLAAVQAAEGGRVEAAGTSARIGDELVSVLISGRARVVGVAADEHKWHARHRRVNHLRGEQRAGQTEVLESAEEPVDPAAAARAESKVDRGRGAAHRFG